jgi:hypothetical protein
MDQRTQVTCPYCLSTEGYVRQVFVNRDRRTFRYTCEDCKRMWKGEEHRVVQPTEGRPDERVVEEETVDDMQLELDG